jgi:hypothetical protein
MKSILSIFQGKTALIISIFIVIFAVTTQLLAATGAISLSTTLQLTMWLIAAGLIVLLWIPDIASHAYVTAKRPDEGSGPPVGSHENVIDMPGRSNQRATLDEALQNHSEIPVDMTKVFAHGCWLAPGPISKAEDKITGKPVFRYRVLEDDLGHGSPLRQTVIEIPADQMTNQPTLAPYEPVKFEHLTVTPDDSLRATGIKPATPRPATDQKNPAARSGAGGAVDTKAG